MTIFFEEVKTRERPPVNLEYITTPEDAREVARYLEDLHRIHNENPEKEDLMLAVDAETRPLIPCEGASRPIKIGGMYQGMIKLLQIGVAPEIRDVQFLLDIEKLHEAGMPPKEVGKLFKKVLESSIVLGQNLKYDWQFLFVHLGIRLRRMRDVMLMGQIEKAGDKNSNSLTALLYRYFKDKKNFFKENTGFETFEEFEAFKKTEQKDGWVGDLSENKLTYAALDIRLLFPLFEAICESLDEFVARYERGNNPGQTVFNAVLLECQLIPVYALMELRGVRFDKRHHAGTVIPFLEKMMRESEKLVGDYFTQEVKQSNGKRGKAREVWFETVPININSHTQIAKSLRDAGVELPDVNTTASETLSKLQNRHPAIPEILRYKKASSLKSKFGDKLVNLTTPCGSIYASWFQIGAGDDGSIDTGRSSCKDPNLQQIPNKEDAQMSAWKGELHLEKDDSVAAELFRKSFICRAGSILIDSDYSQIEPRLQAEIAMELEQIAAFIEEEKTGIAVDTHALTAKSMFGLDYLPKKGGKGSNEREAGKILNLGIGYGMGAKKLAGKITEAWQKEDPNAEECTVDDAKKLIETYYANLPGINKLKKTIERKVRARPDALGSLAPFRGGEPIYVEFTVLGRPRRWCLKHTKEQNQEKLAWEEPFKLEKWYKGGRNTFNERLSEISREAYNFIIQGTCADILKKALILVQEEFDNAGFDIINEGIIMVVHDEIVAEVKEEHADQALEIIDRCMKTSAREVLKNVPCKVGIQKGYNWAECH
jgi:DNA polymerase I